MSITGIISSIAGPIINAISSSGLSEEKKIELASALDLKSKELDIKLNEHLASMMNSQKDVLVAEIQGEEKVQKNWRPHLMYLFMFILAFNYIIAPIMSSLGAMVQPLPLPGELWTLLITGVNGYIGARTFEKFIKKK